jgi:hypothetical protein
MSHSMTRVSYRPGGMALLSLAAATLGGAPAAKADLIGAQVSIGGCPKRLIKFALHRRRRRVRRQ